MLQLNYIRENRDTVIERLAVKHFKEIGLVDEIISLDEDRRKIQSESDALSAEANAAAKKKKLKPLNPNPRGIRSK